MTIRHILLPGIMAACLSISSAVGTINGGPLRSSLPTVSAAKGILNSTTRHREWVRIPAGAASTLAFVVYPERADKAPSIVVTYGSESTNVQARAVADQLAAEGFISIVPDILTGLGPKAARAYAAALPAANGTTAQIDFDFDNSRAVVGTTEFTLTAAAWPEIVGHLSHLTGNHPMLGQTTGSIAGGEHAMH